MLSVSTNVFVIKSAAIASLACCILLNPTTVCGRSCKMCCHCDLELVKKLILLFLSQLVPFICFCFLHAHTRAQWYADGPSDDSSDATDASFYAASRHSSTSHSAWHSWNDCSSSTVASGSTFFGWSFAAIPFSSFESDAFSGCCSCSPGRNRSTLVTSSNCSEPCLAIKANCSIFFCPSLQGSVRIVVARRRTCW